jgi:hypothetical protein
MRMAEAESSRKTGKPWTDEDIDELRRLAAGHTPTGIISLRLGRGEEAVQAKAAELGLSLAPVNRPPSGTTS